MKLLYIYAIILICFYIYYVFTYTNICETFASTNNNNTCEYEPDDTCTNDKYTPGNIQKQLTKNYSNYLDVFSLKNISLRYQWCANHGYCGETSFISALMYYGGYMSQYTMRQLAMKYNKETTHICGQLLLNGNTDTNIAKKLGFTYESYPNKNTPNEDTDDFINWIKTNNSKQYPVIIGVYMNSVILDCDDCNNCEGDSEYDHIVSVLSVNDDNLLTICDNGLYTPTNSTPPQYIFPKITPMNRNDAYCNYDTDDTDDSTIYAIPNEVQNYGITITGLMDKETIPIRVIADKNYEPFMYDATNNPPKPSTITLTLYLSKLIPTKNYDLYKCTNINNLPKSHPISNNKDNILIQTITADSEKMIINTIKSKDAQGNIINKPITIKSSDTAIFRCYPSQTNLLKQKAI